MSKSPMTKAGFEAINLELNNLLKNDREKVKVEIAEAREHGDLKENAEYHAAKEKQSHIEGRIGELQAKIATAEVIDPTIIDKEQIVFSATVKLFSEEKDQSYTYQIVGQDEAMTSDTKISFSSPLGKALLGKEEGDEIIVKAPKGDVIYEVESVEYK